MASRFGWKGLRSLSEEVRLCGNDGADRSSPLPAVSFILYISGVAASLSYAGVRAASLRNTSIYGDVCCRRTIYGDVSALERLLRQRRVTSIVGVAVSCFVNVADSS